MILLYITDRHVFNFNHFKLQQWYCPICCVHSSLHVLLLLFMTLIPVTCREKQGLQLEGCFDLYSSVCCCFIIIFHISNYMVLWWPQTWVMIFEFLRKIFLRICIHNNLAQFNKDIPLQLFLILPTLLAKDMCLT